MTESGILILGNGGHARAVIEVMHALNLPVGEAVSTPAADLDQWRDIYSRAVIAVGQIKSPQIRIDLFEAALKFGFVMPTIVSPRAWVASTSTIENGTVVMHGAFVNASAKVGSNCILNTNSVVEHDVVVGDHCHISTGAIVNGGVQIGNGTFIGSHATIREGVTIGERKVIAMGEIVRRDIL